MVSGSMGGECSPIILMFQLWVLSSPPPASIHGINERISVQAYENQVKFMFEFIQNADTEQKPASHLHEL